MENALIIGWNKPVAGREKQAMELYAKLDKQADVCMGCSAPCVGACPHGIQIQERTLGAHEMLTFRG